MYLDISFAITSFFGLLFTTITPFSTLEFKTGVGIAWKIVMIITAFWQFAAFIVGIMAYIMKGKKQTTAIIVLAMSMRCIALFAGVIALALHATDKIVLWAFISGVCGCLMVGVSLVLVIILQKSGTSQTGAGPDQSTGPSCQTGVNQGEIYMLKYENSGYRHEDQSGIRY